MRPQGKEPDPSQADYDTELSELTAAKWRAMAEP